MFLLDSLFVGGFKFVLRRLAEVVDAELNDDRVFREELLAAQMRLELGEISEEEFAAVEGDLLGRIREIREREADGEEPGAVRVTGVEATFTGDEHE